MDQRDVGRGTDAASLRQPKLAVLSSGDMLGDALLRIPFLHAVRQACPSHEIWWIASGGTQMAHACRRITAGMIDVVIEDARLDWPLRATVPRLLKLPRFDLVFDARTRVATVLAARLVLRPKKFFTCLPGFLFASARPRGQWSRPQNMAARTMAMFEAATGRPAPKTTDIPLSNESRILAERLLPTGPRYLGFAPGASGPESAGRSNASPPSRIQ